MRRNSRILALALAVGMSTASTTLANAQATGSTSRMVGAHEETLVLLTDTIIPLFFIPNADTGFFRPARSVLAGRTPGAIMTGCGIGHVYLRLYHPVKSLAVPGAFATTNPYNGKPWILAPITADSTFLQGLDTLAVSGRCAPAAPPGTCLASVDSTGHRWPLLNASGQVLIDSTGYMDVRPVDLPAPDCNLLRNRFLASAPIDSMLIRFIARTYPPPPM